MSHTGPCVACGKEFNTRGRKCGACYQAESRRRRGVPMRESRPSGLICEYADCDLTQYGRGRCRRCYQRDRLRLVRDGRRVDDMPPVGPNQPMDITPPGFRRWYGQPVETIGRWHDDVERGVTIIHWPVKGCPDTCPVCGENIKEAS